MISFIIVSYNSSKTIFATIESIFKSVNRQFEVVVVDNCSSDKEYLEELSKVENITLIKSESNLGFSKANNLGVSKCNGDILFFINPDVYINQDSFISLVENLKPQVVTTSKLYDEFGVPNKSIFLIPFLSNYFKQIFNKKGMVWVHGALLVIHRNDFLCIGQWSEEFFMYSEDVDICYKIHLHGLELKILDEKVIHVGATSTATVWNDLERLTIVEKSSLKFYKKYNKVIDYYIINVLVLAKMLFTGNKSVKNKAVAMLRSMRNA
ncbi:glycosyltransferase family 2 protein [Vibrio sp. Y184]|uniref:glycosyltransferase family 2 protein n=1 Tax=Vibrio sp. Y184 TaxID=3074705 RepID=UPI0029663947|nr:glycosyltransferase [Vibrio sp. Y184]MDW3167948.1 glycosyltransferase [Vibrio sp. Y184]